MSDLTVGYTLSRNDRNNDYERVAAVDFSPENALSATPCSSLCYTPGDMHPTPTLHHVQNGEFAGKHQDAYHCKLRNILSQWGCPDSI